MPLLVERCPALNLFGLTGSVPTTPFFTAGADEDALYAAWVDVVVTSPGTAGSLVVSLSYSNGTAAAGASILNSPAINLAVIGEQGFLLGVLHSVANQPISYGTAVTGAAGNPVYSLRIRLSPLG